MVKILKTSIGTEDLVCNYCHEPITRGQVFLQETTSEENLNHCEDKYYHRECLEEAGVNLYKYKVVGLDEL